MDRKPVKLSWKRILQNRKAKVGIGSAIFSFCFSVLGLGLSMTALHIPALGWSLVGIGIIGMIIGAGLFLSGKNTVYRELVVSTRKDDLIDIPKTLTKMHQQITLIRYKVVKRQVPLDKLQKLQKDAEAISPVPRQILESLKKDIKGDNPDLLKIRAINNWYIGNIFRPRWEMFVTNIGGLLEVEGIGLKPEMEKPEYKNLKSKLELECSGLPKNIVDAAYKYQRYLYGVNSSHLLNDYRVKYGGRQLGTKAEIITTQFYPSGDDWIMNKLMANVTEAIDKFMR